MRKLLVKIFSKSVAQISLEAYRKGQDDMGAAIVFNHKNKVKELWCYEDKDGKYYVLGVIKDEQ